MRYINEDVLIGALFSEEFVGEKPILEFVASLPTADVRENVKGEWEWSYCKLSDGNAVKIYFCPKCRMVDNDTPKFCKHCGADMRGEV